ncbi:MAG: signal peptidase I [Candidatus Faecenecus gallistercoris]|nr:signal peptidase I [Bacillota bacterium]MDD7102490.1 signal peptidase I [Bacillota bacterium]MDY4050737.1 signal peptidase I [Candidatus Faecenecus gallistercoris]PWL71085.1 MAG: signal peptidase I [Bacillota bacterium]CDE07821.1 signal peptidase I [Bacillus sp. CAG:988]
MKILQKILEYLSKILIFELIVLCILAFISTVVLHKDYVNIGGYTFFIVASGSMSGTVDVNDMVIVKITDDFQVGDIVTYQADGYFVTHRIISINKDQIITKGDSNNTEDDPIGRDKIIGKVVAIFPFMAIFEILGAIILISIIVVVFNFETIFRKFIFRKDLSKLKTREIDRLDQEGYSEFIKETLVNMRKRNNNKVKETLSKNWITRLRYVTKINELLRMGKYDVLKELLNSYEVENFEEEDPVFTLAVVEKLKREPISTYTILLLNAILYEDRESFDIVFMFFRNKLIKEYCDIEII